MSEKEKALAAREEALRQREAELDKREKEIKRDFFSQAVQAKKEQWYDKVKLSVKQLNGIIAITGVLLALVVILIILEAAGIFKL